MNQDIITADDLVNGLHERIREAAVPDAIYRHHLEKLWQIFCDRALTPCAKVVAAALFKYTDFMTGWGSPSYQTLASDTGYGVSSVRDALAELVKADHIYRKRAALGDDGTRAHYSFTSTRELRPIYLAQAVTERMNAIRDAMYRGGNRLELPERTAGKTRQLALSDCRENPAVSTERLPGKPRSQEGGEGATAAATTAGKTPQQPRGDCRENPAVGPNCRVLPKQKIPRGDVENITTVGEEDRSATATSIDLFGDVPDQDHRIEGIEVPEHLVDAIEQALREANGRSLVKSLRATVRKQSRAGFADQDIRDAMSMGASVEIEEASEAGRVAKPAAIIGRARRYVEQVRIQEERRTSRSARASASPLSSYDKAGSGFIPADDGL